MRLLFVIILSLAAYLVSEFALSASQDKQEIIFISLKADKVRLRVGPGVDYPIDWIYQRKNWPVERLRSFGNWRLIRDYDGTQGWVHSSLLSKRRYALIAPWGKKEVKVEMHQEVDDISKLVARLNPLVLVRLLSCTGVWCSISVKGYSGWVKQGVLWGTHEGEVFDGD